MPYSLREALAGLRRTPLLAALSVVAIALSLYVVGVFALTAYNIRRAIESMEDRVEVVAYVRDSATDAELSVLARELGSSPEVAEVRVVTKTEALTTAVQELDEFRDVFSDLEVNPLPASLEVRLRPGYRDPASAERLAAQLLADPLVEEVEFGREWIEKIVSLRRIAGGASAILGGAFAAVAAIIIATAVRIAVFARREEIAIMRLVGATNGFIRRPFLFEGLIAGLLGGAIAVALTWATFRAVDLALLRLAWMPAEWTALGIVVGAAFGLAASAVSVRRHLRAI